MKIILLFIGGYETVLILLVVLLLFGAKRLPELARGLGKGINEFKKATSEMKSEINNSELDKESKEIDKKLKT